MFLIIENILLEVDKEIREKIKGNIFIRYNYISHQYIVYFKDATFYSIYGYLCPEYKWNGWGRDSWGWDIDGWSYHTNSAKCHPKYNFLFYDYKYDYISDEYLNTFNREAEKRMCVGLSKELYLKLDIELKKYYLHIIRCLYWSEIEDIPIEMVMLIVSFVSLGDVYVVVVKAEEERRKQKKLAKKKQEYEYRKPKSEK